MSMTSKKLILVVEDNLLNREMLVAILEDQYTVLEAENGREALGIIRQNKDRLALILLDVMMPVMDGFTLLDIIKADKMLSLIPVIVTTQSGSESDEVEALTHGATDFVPKPYCPKVILHRVASLIKLRENAAMVNQLMYDRLTGLYTKEFFYQKVQELLLENPGQKYTIVSSNIENFKLYNDNFGVPSGDRLLKEIASVFTEKVGETGFCGRFGADRFLCIQEKEIEEFDRSIFFDQSVIATASQLNGVVMRWGIYEIDDMTVPVEQMCDRALLAADTIKGQYNQYYAVYDDALRSKLQREKNITDVMEDAIRQKQFTVYLQPKYNLISGDMIGAEALVRWTHPTMGTIYPGEFIPLFEKNGFISFLDQYMWEQVCSLLHDWSERGIPLLPISVNISRSDVYQINIAEILSGLTKKYGIDPSYLHLEITESAYVDNTDKIIQTTDELRGRGFIIEMDDFGSGYSSLNMLSRMKIDILKLDMKFIRSELEKSASESILNDVINMAHRLRLGVVAEGVETFEQMKRLQKIGCDYAQGYYFSKPVPVYEYEELVKSQDPKPDSLISPDNTEKDERLRVLAVDESVAYLNKILTNFNDNFKILTAFDADRAIEYLKGCGDGGVSAVILSMTLPDNGSAAVLKELRQNKLFWNIPVIATVPSGELVEELPLSLETDDFLCRSHPIFDLQRRVQRLIDISTARKREKDLQTEAFQDFLTGLLNRRGLVSALSNTNLGDYPMAVYMFDLDGLKTVNDTYGHEMGDRMILIFSDLLRRITRAYDIQCRYGGDEFLVILKRIENADAAYKKGEEICRIFKDAMNELNLNASCSCGIAITDSMSNNIIDLADKALYAAKRENKGGCCLYDFESSCAAVN